MATRCGHPWRVACGNCGCYTDGAPTPWPALPPLTLTALMVAPPVRTVEYGVKRRGHRTAG